MEEERASDMFGSCGASMSIERGIEQVEIMCTNVYDAGEEE